MSLNSFSKFAAGQGLSSATSTASSKTKLTSTTNAQSKLALSQASDGWMSTKRRGRDDVAIAKDRARALQARRTTNQRGSENPQTKRNVNSRQQKKKSGQYNSSSDEEDDDDIDDFIVDDDYEDDDEILSRNSNDDDDDEESDEGVQEEDEEDDDDNSNEILVAPTNTSKLRNNRKRAYSIGDEDSIEVESFLPIPKWSRTPIPLTSSDEDGNVLGKTNKKQKSVKTRVGKEKSAQLLRKKVQQKNQVKKSLQSSSSEDELSTTNGFNKKPLITETNGMQKSDRPWSLTEKGERVDQKRFDQFIAGSYSNSKGNNDKTGSGTLVRKQQSSSESRTETKEEKKSIPMKQKRLKKKMKSDVTQVESDDDEWLTSKNSTNSIPLKVTDGENKGQNLSVFSRNGLTSYAPLLFSSDEDQTPIKSLSNGSRKHKIQADNDDGDDDDVEMDDDEQMAIALALSASQKEYDMKHKKEMKSKTLNNSIKYMKAKNGSVSSKPLFEEEDIFPAQDEEEDDDEDDVSVEEVTVDERREAALKVLATADRLSQKILQNMRSWSSECKGTETTQGIIVEGALAMHNFSTDVTTSDWISRLEMETICPNTKLADYQLIGVNWLALLHKMKADIGDGVRSNVNGILADVMGLGKTVQTIAFLAWLRTKKRGADNDSTNPPKKEKRVKPHIIIVPASVMDNWLGEFEKFAPHLVVVKYHGSMVEREEKRLDYESRLPRRKRENNASCDIDVVLTTFSYFSGCKDDDRNFLRRFSYDYMVIDEAHTLKNPDSNAYQNIDKLETLHRLLLTGTPVQNSPKELMSLICFLMPFFKSASKSGWEDDEGKKNDGGVSMLEYFVSLEKKGKGGENSDDAVYRKLKQLFAPFVLRRKKEDVLSQSMPPKTREILRVPLSPPMKEMYDAILETHVKAKKKNLISGTASDRFHLFTTLRKVANHPLLLRNRYTSDEDIHHLAYHLRMYGYFGQAESCTLELVKREVRTMSDFHIHHAALDVIDEHISRRKEMERYILRESDLFSSPKLDTLRTRIPELVEKGHRILIFSQWTNCLDLLGCLLETLGLKFFRLDGQTPISTRQDLIDKFNRDVTIPVFLLSTKAGGMGINLTAADVCILHDLDFNPFNDLQAEDRCHRIGQTKPVQVIKMVTMDTVDEDIFHMQERKTQMNAAILENGGSLNAATEKKRETEEIKSMLQNQLDRYLSDRNKQTNSHHKDLIS